MKYKKIRSIYINDKVWELIKNLAEENQRSISNEISVMILKASRRKGENCADSL